MNKRIRELAHESGLPTYNPDGIPTKLEKFAGSIVRECISKIKEVQLIQTTIYPGPEYVEGFNAGMFVAIRTIEEHFGVEE